MTGWPVAWKCFVACLFLEESQQPTWPHVRHSRRCTHFSPVARHSSQPSELGVTGRISLTCGHVWAMTFSFWRNRIALGRYGRLSHSSFRYSCTNWTAMAPSPTAEATRLTESERTSPAANTPGRLVSSRNGGRRAVQWADFTRAGPVRTNPLSSL